MDFFAVHGDLVRFGVDRQPAGCEHTLLFHQRPERDVAPNLRFDPRQQLERRERLCHIVVRAEAQTCDLVGVLAFGREKNDRHVAAFADLHRRRNAVHDGHHDVEDDTVQRLLLRDSHSLFAVICGQNRIALAFQIDPRRVHNRLVVVAHQNLIHETPPSKIGSPAAAPSVSPCGRDG